ncbi:MAG: CRISPR-associated helicase/endonuclease Cas3, partial [Deltaproteobacteria bacterium]
ALLRFIEAFSGAPILLMTASLPRHRLERLQALLGGAFEIVAGPREHEAVQRYILSDPVEEAPWDAVGEVLERGGKVLWVSNRVDRCVAVGRTGEARFPSVPIFPYHSRYRYRDRVTRHEALISAFREAGAAFAVTTQVCEVSLDISADLLVSDLAPVPSLIQRLGRLNRRASPEAPGRPCRAFFLHPSSPAPYEEADLAVAEAWLGALSGRSVSQRDLAEAFERTVPEGEEGGVLPSEWLDGGKVSRRAPLREAGVTITVLRAEDAEAIEAGPGMRKAILANGIPMLLPPVQEGIAPWPLLGHASVAPKGAIAYDVRWGATWRKNPGRPERHDRLR